jgi:hypothetical protein
MLQVGKMRRTQREQIESAIPLSADLDGASSYFAEGPRAEGAAAQRHRAPRRTG